MIRRPPRSTRTDTLFPYTTLFRSGGAILVNTARGEVVDEGALINALGNGRLAAAGLDTTADEPIAPDSPLRSMSNVVLTPHVGGSTGAALSAMAQGAARNILGYLKHQTLDRSEERRVGKECVRTCRIRWSPDH